MYSEPYGRGCRIGPVDAMTAVRGDVEPIAGPQQARLGLVGKPQLGGAGKHTIQHLESVGVDLFLDQQNIDTTTPTGRLLFQITGAFAEFERSMIRSRVNAGLARARAQGKRLGRRPASEAVVKRIREELMTGAGILKTAKALGVGTGTVHRVKREMAAVAA